MSKGGKIAFWISFPLTAVLVYFVILFFFDLSNGPIVLLVLELIAFSLALIIRIILRNKRFVIRMIPTISLALILVLLMGLSRPSVEKKSAAYYENPTQTEVLRLANGDVQGVYNKDKTVEIYAGIPYAEAPSGEHRWKEPVPVKNWEGVKDCSYFGPRAMQVDQSPFITSAVDMYAQKGWHPDYTMHPLEPMSEDCLSLTIWKPVTEEKNLPILVYIHGGSLTTGGASYEDYNGEEVAKKGVIMINIQYRLGIFGYFAHEELIKESVNGTTGNYGLLDQIEALRWVNNNAAYFGGDNTNITIAGESAGSSSVSALCSSPRAKGLFKRAIGDSSSVVVKTPPHTYRKMEDALKTGDAIMKEMNCSSIEELRKVDANKLLSTKYTNSSMTLDGYALEENPYDAYVNHHNNEVELLNGFNVLEADAFVVPQYLLSPTSKDNIHARLVETFGEIYAAKIETLYKDKIEKDAFSTFNEIFSVYWFMHPHYSWRNLASNNGVKVYSYQFTKDNGFYGTYHSGELIYCFNGFSKSNHKSSYNESDHKLGETMLAYWTNFAKSGNPNGEGLFLWDEYDPNKQEIMELGEHVGPIKDPYVDLYPIIDEFIDSRLLK